MLLNNAKYSTFFEYKDIAPVLEGGKLIWYAWFYKDVGADDVKILEQGSDGEAEVNNG